MRGFIVLRCFCIRHRVCQRGVSGHLRYCQEHFNYRPTCASSSTLSSAARIVMVRQMTAAGLVPKTCVDQCPEVKVVGEVCGA